MTFSEVCESFFQLEQDLYVFEWEVDGIRVWELIRFKVFNTIMQELGFYGQAHTVPDRGIKAKIIMSYRLLKSYIFYNPFCIKKHSIIFNGHPRRKLLSDGFYWDIYSDYVANLVQDGVVLEQHYGNGHLIPAKSVRLYYNDFITTLSYFCSCFKLHNKNNIDSSVCKSIENAVTFNFNINVDVYGVARKVLERYKVDLYLFKELFKIVKPRACFVLASYGRNSFIAAAKECKIPTIELQHGVVSRYHMAYSFPYKNNKYNFPDYFFAFGEYWKQNVDFPIPSEKIYNIGYPHLETCRSALKHIPKADTLVFISQGTIGKRLSHFAVQLRQSAPAHVRIVYKLHPGEYDRWREDYPWLVDSDLEIVDSHTPDLYELFAQAKWQIGVYSTAVFEGLAFHCQTYLVDLPGVDYMRPLLDSGYAQLIKKAVEVKFRYDPVEIDKHYFFAENWKQNFQHAVAEILGEDAIKRNQ
ncbi:hypothetical protein [Desulfovermiculus halophilus]|uniref:hypothetical protein n=1 Tax=Desulfovermiculus halophilus TaxID=339722 RepID=UPI000687E1AB|nr:hypothetical protein [Desulfovermiculus halophilus]